MFENRPKIEKIPQTDVPKAPRVGNIATMSSLLPVSQSSTVQQTTQNGLAYIPPRMKANILTVASIPFLPASSHSDNVVDTVTNSAKVNSNLINESKSGNVVNKQRGSIVIPTRNTSEEFSIRRDIIREAVTAELNKGYSNKEVVAMELNRDYSNKEVVIAKKGFFGEINWDLSHFNKT